MSFFGIDLQYAFLALNMWVMNNLVALKVILVASGLGISLLGSLIASRLPFERGFKLAGTWGGGTEEQWIVVNSLFQTKTRRANVCFAIGTFLQIVGVLW